LTAFEGYGRPADVTNYMPKYRWSRYADCFTAYGIGEDVKRALLLEFGRYCIFTGD
jgi:hypothetical protein